MKCAIVCQARMTSIRLPGKVLSIIKNKPLLEYHLERVRASHLPVILATSTDVTDDPIATLGHKLSIPVFRGDLANVLDRYWTCAKKYALDIIIRTTGDCPLIDGHLIKTGFDVFIKKRPDYLSNTLTRTFPRGFDFEIFTQKALHAAHQHARTSFEKEHVTPYIWQTKKKAFKIQQLTRSLDASRFRVTVDTQEDFLLIKKLIEIYQAHTKQAEEIIKLLEMHPEVVQLNAQVKQKTT